jgi:hypothetical protein
VVLRRPQLAEGPLEVGVLPLEIPQERLALGGQAMALHGAADHVEQLLRIPGLEEEVVDVGGVDGLHEGVGVREGGEEDAHGLRRHLASARQQLGARHPRHPLVADHEGHAPGAEQPQRLLGPVGAQDRVVHGEERLERVEHAGLVVDDEDGGVGHATPAA